MKQLFTVFSIFILFVAISGCKKEYNGTCTCISTDVSGAYGSTTRPSEPITTSNKNEAEKLCSERGSTAGTIETVCSLD